MTSTLTRPVSPVQQDRLRSIGFLPGGDPKPVQKIFIGVHNISSQVQDFARAFQELGYETMSVVDVHKRIVSNEGIDVVLEDHLPDANWFPTTHEAAHVRHHISDALKSYHWERALDECDTFFFIWSSFRPDFSDFEELKRRGKRIIVFLVGDDVRWVPAMEQEFAHYGMPPIEYHSGYHMPGDLPSNQLHFIRMAEKYADLICSHPATSQLALRPYYWAGPPLDLEPFRHNPVQRKVPLVVHAPSSAHFKGTRYVMPVLERLKAEGVPFEYELIQNLPYAEAIERYADADMLVGQMLCPPGGRQEREFLACGGVVLSSMRYDYTPHSHVFKPDECPIIDVGPDTLYDELKAAILDHERRVQLAKRARPYMEQYHAITPFCDKLLGWLQHPEEHPPHYQPTFFRERYQPETPGAARLYNLYTDFVNDCDWYADAVPSGTRGNLLF